MKEWVEDALTFASAGFSPTVHIGDREKYICPSDKGKHKSADTRVLAGEPVVAHTVCLS